MSNFTARWATSVENHSLNDGLSNAAVIDETTRDRCVVCFTSPMNMAMRIAYSLNLSAKFSLDELSRISAALVDDKRDA